MNGREIERLLTLIDENIAQNERRFSDEVFSYLQQNEVEAIRQLRETQQLEVPTTRGRIMFTLQELQAAAA